MFTLIACTIFIRLNPSAYSSSSSSNWFLRNINNLKNPNFLSPNTSHFSSLISHFLPNSSSSLTPCFLSPDSNQTQIVGNFTSPRKIDWESMLHCDIFDGKWVKDDSYPLYAPGSCPIIDESFNCFINGRPDNSYEKFRWQSNYCNIPRGGRWTSGQKLRQKTERFKKETYFTKLTPQNASNGKRDEADKDACFLLISITR